MSEKEGKNLCIRNVDKEAYNAFVRHCRREGLKQGPALSKMVRYYFDMKPYPTPKKIKKEHYHGNL